MILVALMLAAQAAPTPEPSASGEVTVDIDDDKWPESKPILNTRVRIHGEVERKLISRRVEVDVDRMEVLK